MYSRMTICLDERERKALEVMAERDYRGPKEQVRYLVREAAQRQGMMTDDTQKKAVDKANPRDDQNPARTPGS